MSMSATGEITDQIEAALLEGASVRRVIDLKVVGDGADMIVGAKIDIAAELTMKEVSVILLQAKRRVRALVPEAKAVFIEPDVWVDPDAVHPTTSAVVTLSYD